MKTYDEQAASVLAEWTEREMRATLGAPPRAIQKDNEYNPTGPHRWFAEAVADISAIIAMRQMAETWKVRPPYASWRSRAPGIRQRADEMVIAAKLPPGMTFAQWFVENEVLLQQDPTVERTRIVATALLPVFMEYPDCWQAMESLDDDIGQRTLASGGAGSLATCGQGATPCRGKARSRRAVWPFLYTLHDARCKV